MTEIEVPLPCTSWWGPGWLWTRKEQHWCSTAGWSVRQTDLSSSTEQRENLKYDIKRKKWVTIIVTCPQLWQTVDLIRTQNKTHSLCSLCWKMTRNPALPPIACISKSYLLNFIFSIKCLKNIPCTFRANLFLFCVDILANKTGSKLKHVHYCIWAEIVWISVCLCVCVLTIALQPLINIRTVYESKLISLVHSTTPQD